MPITMAYNSYRQPTQADIQLKETLQKNYSISCFTFKYIDVIYRLIFNNKLVLQNYDLGTAQVQIFYLFSFMLMWIY